MRDTVSPSRFRRMTLPHSNLAPSELNKLRQQSALLHGTGEGAVVKQERSASTSTSGYAGSNESNQLINANQSITLAGNALHGHKVTRSQSVAGKDHPDDVGARTGARPKTSLTTVGDTSTMSTSEVASDSDRAKRKRILYQNTWPTAKEELLDPSCAQKRSCPTSSDIW